MSCLNKALCLTSPKGGKKAGKCGNPKDVKS